MLPEGKQERGKSMRQKKIFAYLDAQNVSKAEILGAASFYDTNGVDGLFLYNYSADEKEREEFYLNAIKIFYFVFCRFHRLDERRKSNNPDSFFLNVGGQSLTKGEQQNHQNPKNKHIVRVRVLNHRFGPMTHLGFDEK